MIGPKPARSQASEEIHVTEVLSVLGTGLEYINPHILQEAARIGTETHRHALGALKGAYVPAPPEIEPYVQKVLRWVELTRFLPWETEIEIRIHALKIVGRVDLIGFFPNEKLPVVIDLKRTASVGWTTGLQLAAYKEGLERLYRRKFGRRIALNIPKEGECKAIDNWPDDDLVAFYAAVTLYQHSKKRR